MAQIDLSGLLVHHPISILATFGLYVIDPDAKIYFRPNLPSFSPIFETNKFQNIDELVAHLKDPNTWTNILPSSVDKFSLPEFLKIKNSNPELAAGLGTDLYLKPHENDIEPNGEKTLMVGRTPFCFVARRFTFKSGCKSHKSLLDKEEIKYNLSNFPWKKITGSNFGFFPDSPIMGDGKVRRNYKSSKTVPSLVLLALASLKLFPCFAQGKYTLASGWSIENREMTFIYPIWSHPQKYKEAVSWLQHKELINFSKKRSVWTKMGIIAVYQTKQSMATGGNGDGNLSTTKRL